MTSPAMTKELTIKLIAALTIARKHRRLMVLKAKRCG
jgi:hypothetical protein